MIDLIRKEIKKAVPENVVFDVNVSEKPEFGHYSSNVAFKLALIYKKPPFEIAKELAETLKAASGKYFLKIEAAAPGFLNFWLSQEVLIGELENILKTKKSFGKLRTKESLKINLEFVSANPTGPLTMANGRGGFYGDVLGNVLALAGHKVVREYYVNDAGNQVKTLGQSILASLGRIPFQETYYRGEYVKSLAASLKRYAAQPAEKIGKKAAEILLRQIKVSLKKAGIKHNVWFSEDKNLRRKGELKKVLDLLKEKGLAYEKDGATWLGDAVLIKSDGEPTYFLGDLSYHYDKLIKRKFDLAIDIWGTDHHGYSEKLRKEIGALGIDKSRLKIILTQLVRLVSGGQEAKMSKRKGEFVTMEELLEQISPDVARFFFLMHSLDTHMDFDLDLAKEKSQKNPVYYAQYAYVRCVNILQKSKIKNQKLKLQIKNLKLLNSESEIKLMLELSNFPDIIEQTSEDFQVHRLTKYAGDLAAVFHNFYEKEKVIGAGGELEKARIALLTATKIVFENLFDVLGISKPEKM